MLTESSPANSAPTSARTASVANRAALKDRLQKFDYLADASLLTSIHLALELKKPLFLEGEPGVGKTEVAKVLAKHLELPLIRLQCYEGLDTAQALYEWNYPAQLLAIRAAEANNGETKPLFSREFLLARPLLQAIDPEGLNGRAVLLIDELDRSDAEFEAFLLEVLADFQITIPELGTLAAAQPPVVVITSNRTREIHDALKRRCLYHWIDFPDFDKELAIIRRRAPDAPERLAVEVTGFLQALRQEDLYKGPGIAESIDWVQALLALDQETLSDSVLRDTLGVLLKYRDDLDAIDSDAAKRLLQAATDASTRHDSNRRSG